MIRKLYFPIVLSLVVAHAVTLPARADDDILAAEKHWAKSVMAMDFTALDQIYSDDLIYAHSTGVIETKREYLDKLKKGTQKYELIEHQKSTTKKFGDAAIAHSIVRMKGTSASGPFDSKLMLIHVWVMQNGKWRLVAHQTTKLEDL